MLRKSIHLSSWRKPGPITPGLCNGNNYTRAASRDHAVWVLAFARTTSMDLKQW
jgi:hypothetical protein